MSLKDEIRSRFRERQLEKVEEITDFKTGEKDEGEGEWVMCNLVLVPSDSDKTVCLYKDMPNIVQSLDIVNGDKVEISVVTSRRELEGE